MRSAIIEVISLLPLICLHVAALVVVMLLWGLRRAVLILGTGALVLLGAWAVLAGVAYWQGDLQAGWVAGAGLGMMVMPGLQLWLAIVAVISVLTGVWRFLAAVRWTG